MNREKLAARLLATFLGEMEEQLRVMDAELLALEADPADVGRVRSLFRVAHTLKGAARAAGVPLVEETCHALEALLARVRDGKERLEEGEFALLFSAVDALADAGERITAGRELADSPLAELARRLRGPAPRGAPARPAERTPPPAPAGSAARPAADRRGEQVRVPAEGLDALVASAGELLVTSRRLAARPEELHTLHEFASRWAAGWRRTGRTLRSSLERAGAQDAALDALAGMEEKLQHLLRETGRIAAEARKDARAVARVGEEVGERVHRLRLRPFADACEALPRVVRDVATAARKEARLEVSGGETAADRAVIDGLREALLHLVRNAVDHGIEPPEARERAGKPRVGTVSVSAALRGDRIRVTVADDGSGLNVPVIREQLARRGLPVPAEERELGPALFEAGFSTRAMPTAISGRGVGLDVVREAVARIRGTVEVAWEAGRETTFVLDCPLTLATVRVLLARVGARVLAVPTAHVEHLQRIRPEELRSVEGRAVLTTSGAPVPVTSLARVLGPPLEESPVTGPVPAIHMVAGSRRLAVVVDDLLAEQVVVVRPLEAIRTPLPHLSGATLLGSGRVALVLDPPAVVARGLALGSGLSVAEAHPAASAPRRRILVVDDSITTRTLEQSILEAAGYEVATAADGAEGWRLLKEEEFDLVVSDVEMPRMDGFTLCEAIRASERVRELPVVLVTALETPEHRERGLEAGADAYLVKSSFDQEDLLDTIRQLIGAP